MTPETATGPGTPVPPKAATPSVEGILSQQAGDAIAKGAPVEQVNARLKVMIDHLRATPGLAAQASDAIAKGADPVAVSQRLYQHASQPTQPAQPQYTPGQEFGTAIAQGATFGFAPKILGGLDAVDKYLHGDHNFGANYAATRDRIAGAETAAMNDHPVATSLTELLSGVGTSLAGPAVAEGARLASGTAAPVAAAAKTPLLQAIGKGAAAGAGYGALAGAGHATGDVKDYAGSMARDALLGGAIGGIAPGVGRSAGWLGTKAVDFVGRPSDSRPFFTVPVINTPVGRIQGVSERALQKLQGLAGEDAANGAVPNTPTHPSLPAIPLDQAGPAVRGYTEQIANRPGPARGIIMNALDARLKNMRPAITSVFNDATGTTPESGNALVRSLNDERGQMASQANVRDAVTADAKTAAPDVQTPTPADVWAQAVGGEHPNPIQRLRELDNAQRTEGDQLFGRARQATAGQPIDSPTLRQFQDTPVGKIVFAWAKQQKANRLAALPTTTETVLPPRMQTLLDQAKPADRPAMLERFKQTGAGTDVTREVPDPELLHYAKQRTAQLARMGVNDGAQGTIATQAQGALPLFRAIKSEMPDEWNEADAAWSAAERKKAALNAGRNILRTQVNPAGVGRKPLTNSLDALAQQVKGMTPAELEQFRYGAQGAISHLLQSGHSTDAFVRDLSNPASDMARRVALAMGDEGAPAKLAQQMQPTVIPQQIPEAPPEPTMSPEGQGASLGLDVLKHKVAPSSSAPEKSLAVFADRAKALQPEGKITLQQGAAQALRGQWEGASGSVKSPGRVFDFKSPEMAQQMGYAFRSPAKQADFKQAVDAWDAAQSLREDVLGNSKTAVRTQGPSGQVQPGTFLSHARRMAQTLINKVAGNVRARNQAQLEEQVARMITDPAYMSLPSGQRAAAIHDGILRAVQGNLPTAPIPSSQQQH